MARADLPQTPAPRELVSTMAEYEEGKKNESIKHGARAAQSQKLSSDQHGSDLGERSGLQSA
jgi:hypothetical protein